MRKKLLAATSLKFTKKKEEGTVGVGEKKYYLTDLPIELLIKIVSFLPHLDVLPLILVSCYLKDQLSAAGFMPLFENEQYLRCTTSSIIKSSQRGVLLTDASYPVLLNYQCKTTEALLNRLVSIKDNAERQRKMDNALVVACFTGNLHQINKLLTQGANPMAPYCPLEKEEQEFKGSMAANYLWKRKATSFHIAFARGSCAMLTSLWEAVEKDQQKNIKELRDSEAAPPAHYCALDTYLPKEANILKMKDETFWYKLFNFYVSHICNIADCNKQLDNQHKTVLDCVITEVGKMGIEPAHRDSQIALTKVLIKLGAKSTLPTPPQAARLIHTW